MRKGVMVAAEEFVNTVRIRVTFPKPAYARLRQFADAVSIPVPDLVRTMASLQLVQWEMAYLNPRSMIADNAELTSRMEKSVAQLFPDVPNMEEELQEEE